MRKHRGFTLIELTVATLISCFIILTLVTLCSSVKRHMLQNYRSNAVKENVSLGMLGIRNAMSQATRIDWPLVNTIGNRLAVASNVDQLTGCYPIKPGLPAAWHLFCTVKKNDSLQLYYYTADYGAAPECACPGNCVTTTNNPPAFYISCGISPGGTLLTEYLYDDSIFSRAWLMKGGIPTNDHLSVRVKLRSIWTPPDSAAVTQRQVDYSLDSVFSVSRSGF